MTIDHGDSRPPYRQLAAIMRQRIADGEFAGGRLPGEKTLAQEYGLAIGTVRKAYAVLREEGLIEAVPGWGRYVTGPRQPGD